ncbi:LexA repressor [Sporotomaculum syntrophicum]|uniref:LexA repressor n=1 Tax=Sporotomaculum syntrophicum TaxID=182264 RepID=A0A9D2WQA0_9FIRM|nr:LexA family transcriptional regulator [Sporotomaculum syntrophicum]KAF1084951.1 LexA repressor [Sporotomaculum syntrophicum]
MATFGERLAKLRKEKELSQADLAGLFKLGQSTIGMYETNKREPDSTVLKGFADFFGVSVDYLLGREYTFAEYLKTLREDKGLSQEQLAGELGVRETTIADLETGKARPGLDFIRLIARTYQLHFNDLLVLAGYGDMADKLSESRNSRPNQAIELLDLLEDSGPARITAGGQPISDEQRIAILRSLINPAGARAKLQIPIVGYIRAGIPLLSEQNIVGMLEIPPDMEGSVDFALIVHGDSLIGVGIAENDLVLCKKSPQAMPGQIVVALVDYDDTTLKFFVKENDRYVLRAANPKYKDIALKPGDQIQGHVVKVFKDPPSINLYREYIYVKDEHLEEWNRIIEEAVGYGIKPEHIRTLIGMQRDMLKQMFGQ